MKKILLFFFLVFMTMNVVQAEDNKLYFTGSGDRLYYKSSLYNEDIFIKHNDMIPGKEFTDTLNIENDTNTNYKLYLKVKEVGDSTSNDLLDNIEMNIYLDNKLIYEGYAKGLDYNRKNVNLQDAIYIGEYGSKDTGSLVVKTKLSNSYSNAQNGNISNVEWEFYAEYDEVVVPINPDTGSRLNGYLKVVIISLIVILLMVLGVLLLDRKKVN